MFSSILVATDLSEASDHVIRCIQGFRKLGSEKAILAHALGIKHLDVMKYEFARFVEPRLLAQKALLESYGFETSIEIAPGIAPHEINRLANEKKVSLIVAGTHGATLAKDILLGSVAFEIINRTTVPALVVRIKITEGELEKRCELACGNFLNNILYPTDFSDAAERAFSYVEKIVETGVKKVMLLHVQDKTRISRHLEDKLEEFNKIDEERLSRIKSKLIEKGATDVQINIPYGSPIQEILKKTRDEDFSLIVMGSQGRGFIAETFLGSVSHNVVRQAPLPVLLVPALR